MGRAGNIIKIYYYFFQKSKIHWKLILKCENCFLTLLRRELYYNELIMKINMYNSFEILM